MNAISLFYTLQWLWRASRNFARSMSIQWCIDRCHWVPLPNPQVLKTRFRYNTVTIGSFVSVQKFLSDPDSSTQPKSGCVCVCVFFQGGVTIFVKLLSVFSPSETLGEHGVTCRQQSLDNAYTYTLYTTHIHTYLHIFIYHTTLYSIHHILCTTLYRTHHIHHPLYTTHYTPHFTPHYTPQKLYTTHWQHTPHYTHHTTYTIHHTRYTPHILYTTHHTIYTHTLYTTHTIHNSLYTQRTLYTTGLCSRGTISSPNDAGTDVIVCKWI